MPDRTELKRLVGVVADHIAKGTLFRAGFYSPAQIADFVREAVKDMQTLDSITQVIRLEEWRESDGPVLWWRLPVDEPPYVGTPVDSGWPGHHTHWTRIPKPVI